MKECKCGKIASFYWITKTGKKLDLCEYHYKELEREVHKKEEARRLLKACFNVVSGKIYKNEECSNGKNCKYCKEFKLTN